MDLMELLPPSYDENATMKELQNIFGADINNLTSNFDKAIDQCFINTATNFLSRYEKIYDLKVDTSKNDEFRRERIRAKVRGIGTVTKQMIVDTAKAYSNGEVEVIENSANNSFTIKFVGTFGLPANMADLTLTIEEIKPAHLSYTFIYIYRTQAQLTAYTHAQLSAFTHQQIREGAIS